ncbi:hypothetical protein GCM10010269_54160 [Streptomyces humidus]|uniref:Uncharacterized protein n=1 Tax=Streptomyces humidus TaxID=52259 RepID=A0A918L666_9ACTN|nr:hypothetical protein [Streptomyces humidus]GGS08180.1 hypothetical protein GCM10010269_54160 [Streptomyces humidus]
MTTERPRPLQDPQPRPEQTGAPAPIREPVPGTASHPIPGPAPDTTPEAVPASKDRRVLRAVLRWTAVVTVFAALGAGTAYGITRMERTDLPGLATQPDGRWAYPDITMPPLPAGSRHPFDTRNWAAGHYADLRALRLPAPGGSTEDKALRGADGWLATKDFLTVFEAEKDRGDVGQLLTDSGLRHIAARGWTTADGTHTGVYLMQFDTGTVAQRVYDTLTSFASPVYAARGAAETEFDEGYPTFADLPNVRRNAYDEAKPYGAEQLRQAYLQAGDVVALVLQSRRGAAAAVPFQQTVALQSQLLS